MSKAKPSFDYQVCQLEKDSWVVLINGRLIQGAVLSSLKSAISYVKSLARACGQAPQRVVINFSMSST